MAQDNTAPATKKDIKILMDEIGKLYDANLKWKEEITRHFDVVAENMHHDLLGAHKDDIENLKNAKNDHEQRIHRLEKHTELVAA
ncbi:MAG: hypothetical protein K9M03_04975 [Kiritimatiellales bacterium]|nr:hypothetical protein [Kiritimatiellales bacterium]